MRKFYFYNLFDRWPSWVINSCKTHVGGDNIENYGIKGHFDEEDSPLRVSCE